MIERPTCETCLFFQPASRENIPNIIIGECRRYPATIQAALEDNNAGLFPSMHKTSWCGEHQDFPAYILAARGVGVPPPHQG